MIPTRNLKALVLVALLSFCPAHVRGYRRQLSFEQDPAPSQVLDQSAGNTQEHFLVRKLLESGVDCTDHTNIIQEGIFCINIEEWFDVSEGMLLTLNPGIDCGKELPLESDICLAGTLWVENPAPTTPPPATPTGTTRPPTTTPPPAAPTVSNPPPAPQGSAPTLSADASAVLAQHNEYRARHGAPPLKWSTKLATSALQWTQQCRDEHSSSPAGENMAAFARSAALNAAGVTNLLVRSVNDWYNEKDDYDFARGTSMGGQATGHFTQVVWKGTQEVGCAITQCDGRKPHWFDGDYPVVYSVVCQYFPAGNIRGQYTANVARNKQ